MSDQLTKVIYCPDCGGVVGATSVTEHGAPCRCFADRPKPKPKPEPDLNEPTDEKAGGESSSNGTAVTDVQESRPEKPCIFCGKNTAGHRRLKDSRGYICLDCAKTEEARKKVQGTSCPKCHRIVKEESMGKHEGQLMCQRCLREAREGARPGSKKYRKIDHSKFEESNKLKVIVLAVLAGVLALFMILGWLSRG